MELLLWLLLLIVIICGYMLPTCIAYNRNHPNAGTILLVNLFLGGTGAGWVIALIWSLSNIKFENFKEEHNNNCLGCFATVIAILVIVGIFGIFIGLLGDNGEDIPSTEIPSVVEKRDTRNIIKIEQPRAKEEKAEFEQTAQKEKEAIKVQKKESRLKAKEDRALQKAQKKEAKKNAKKQSSTKNQNIDIQEPQTINSDKGE